MTMLLVLGAVLVLVLLAVVLLLMFTMRTADRRHAVALEQVSDQQGAAVDSAVAAAVSATLAERDATAETLNRDREQTVQAAVERAAEVAEAKFSASLAAGSERLDARMAQGDHKIEAGTRQFAEQVQTLNGELQRMGQVVSSLQKENAQMRGEVVEGLRQATRATAELKNTTGSLREALASPKARGQWGERMAEDILTRAGMVEGINFRQQKGIAGGGIPDFTFLLPRDLVLHMDVKFPIDNYLRFLNAEAAQDQAAADRAAAQFKKDVRQKVKELADRRYADASDTVDYVLLFIPNESVYAFLHERDAEIVDVGLRQKVVLCSPSTLFAVLAVIRQAVDVFMTERRGDEILEGLHRFGSEWTKFTDQIDKVGKHLGTLSNSFEALNGPRRNQMERQIQRVSDLREERGLVAEQRPHIEAIPRPTAVEPVAVDTETIEVDDDMIESAAVAGDHDGLFGTVEDTDRLFGSSTDSYPRLRRVSGGK